MFRIVLILFAVLGVALSHPAEARRAALIIGNSNYVYTPMLPNPPADSRLVAESARLAGFDDVMVVTDVTKAGFDQALFEFRKRADGAEVAMIYFAGHGIENAGTNWMIPTDARLEETRDLRFQAIELDALLETLNNAQLRIVILDACRNNPFGSQWRSTVRSVPKGLAEPERVEGALVVFAAAGGQVATDGVGANSPFAMAVAKRLPERGLSIHRLGSVIREDVAQATGNKQTPWTNTSIDGREFYLVPSAEVATSGATVTTGQEDRSEIFAWRLADKLNSVEEYENYLSQFPRGVFTQDARSRIARLQSAGLTAAKPPVTATVSSSRPAASPPPVSSVPSGNLAVAVKPPLATAPVSGSPAGAQGRPMPPADGDSNSIALVTAAANTVNDRAPLPKLSATPVFPADGYPDCREEHQSLPNALGRVVKVNECMSKLSSYFESVMNGYARSMIQHQEAISRLYTQSVAGNVQYSPESQQSFYREMMKEHSASNPDGANFAAFRAARDRYEKDREYLQDRYCFNTGACGGYPVPVGVGKGQP